MLEVGESVITHRRRSASGDGPAWPVQSALSLLLLDPTNPRSVAFQLARLATDLRVLGDPTLAGEVEEVARALDDVDLHEVTVGDRHALAELLDGIHRRLRSINDGLTRRHFSRMAPQRVLLTDWTPGGAVRVPPAEGVPGAADRR